MEGTDVCRLKMWYLIDKQMILEISKWPLETWIESFWKEFGAKEKNTIMYFDWYIVYSKLLF